MSPRPLTAGVPRLYVMMRPETARAVIVLRGATRMSATFGWNLDTDEITDGQMMKGQIYSQHGDVSPDGAWMYYLAADGRAHDPVTEGRYAVLSRAPYLKAVKLYPYRTQWEGARMIVSVPPRRRKSLASRVRGPHNGVDDPRFEPFAVQVSTYARRLVRDGWTQIATREGATVLRRALPGKCALEKTAHPPAPRSARSDCFETHAIVDRHGQVIPLAGWDWADVRDDRLLWACAGVLSSSRKVEPDGRITGVRVVRDFCDLRFVRQLAPY